jgi:hypothetical protein
VVSETFNFFSTHFWATLRDFLGGTGRLASRLAGGSLKREERAAIQGG